MPDHPHPGNANLPIGRRHADKLAPTPHTTSSRGWHSRGYLPHFDGTLTQHVTIHLADSLPEEVVKRITRRIETLPEEQRDAQKRQRVDDWIDAGHGWCILREPEIASMTQHALLHFDAERYRLLAWAIMPNHAHVLFQPLNRWSMESIVASWKKFTARAISDWRNTRERQSPDWPSWSAPIWHREYWDRYMRDEYHLRQTIRYIHQNPVKAKLAANAEDWPWSSAFPGNADLPIGRRTVANEANQEIGVPREKI